MPSSKNSQKTSTSRFLELVTEGLSKDQSLLSVIHKIAELNGSVFVVAIPKSPDIVEDVKELLVDRIRELPEEYGLVFTAKAQQNEVGVRTYLFIKLTPKDPDARH